MRLGIDPLLPLAWLLPAAVALLIASVWYYWRWKPVLSPRYWRGLLALKFLGLATVVCLLLNPHFVRREPDQRKFSVAFIVDATGSMGNKDCDDKRRLDIVKAKVLAPESRFSRQVMNTFKNKRVYLLSGPNLRRIDATQEFDVLPGHTDIDTALQKLSTMSADDRLGAVVLISDGVDNEGLSLLEGAKPFRAAGVPVHCIGIGDPRSKPDISITFTDPPRKIVKGRVFKLNTLLQRNTRNEEKVMVQLFESGRLVMEQEVSFAKDEQQKEVPFELTAFATGLKTYKATVSKLPKELNILNNVSFVTLKIEPPDVFKVIYFSDTLSWEYKYLRLLAKEQEKLQLSARVRLSETSWMSFGLVDDNTKEDGFPDGDVLNTHDCLIMSLGAVQLLNDEQLADLFGFVENRGGGLILTGTAEEVPAQLSKLAPVKFESMQLNQIAKAKIKVKASSILAAQRGDVRGSLQGRVYQPADAPFLALAKASAKPGAKIPASIPGDYITVATHNYGSGKVAFLNLADSWKWVMRTDGGMDNFALLWGRLIAWSASSPKARITVRPSSSTVALGEAQRITVDVLTPDFRPDNQAGVDLTITNPDGTEQKLRLFQSPRTDGRYLGKFIPHQSGEHKFQILAKLSNGEKLEALADYVAVPDSNELQPSPMAERELQSLARVTDGQYWGWNEIDGIKDIPLSKKLSYLETRHDFRQFWAFLIAVLLFLLPDWMLRRRVGLR